MQDVDVDHGGSHRTKIMQTKILERRGIYIWDVGKRRQAAATKRICDCGRKLGAPQTHDNRCASSL